jgi:hypothetical protein
MIEVKSSQPIENFGAFVQATIKCFVAIHQRLPDVITCNPSLGNAVIKALVYLGQERIDVSFDYGCPVTGLRLE